MAKPTYTPVEMTLEEVRQWLAEYDKEARDFWLSQPLTEDLRECIRTNLLDFGPEDMGERILVADSDHAREYGL